MPSEVRIYNIDVRLETDTTRKRQIPSEGWTRTQRRKKRDHETQALIIQAKGKTYAELLKKVRNKVSADDVSDPVKDLQKTRNGDLLVTLKNKEELKQLWAILSTKLKGGNIKKAGDNRVPLIFKT